MAWHPADPHPVTNLMFGRVSPEFRESERDARITLERTCTFCGCFTHHPYDRRAPGPQQWLKPVWTACEDAECRARVDAAVTDHQNKRSAA